MHKLLGVVLLWLFASGIAFAQTDTSVAKNFSSANQFYLKINPLALLEMDGGVAFAVEYIWAKRKLGFQLEVQPVFLSTDDIITNPDGTNGFEAPANTISSSLPRGIEIRPEIRYYFTLASAKRHTKLTNFINDIIWFRNRKTSLKTFAAIDFLYKSTRRERLGNVSISNGSVGTAYMQKAIYNDLKKVIGFDLKVGVITSISKTNRWFMEAYCGLGYRHKKYSYENLPLGAGQPARNTFVDTRAPTDLSENLGMNVHGISLPVGFKLVYRLR